MGRKVCAFLQNSAAGILAIWPKINIGTSLINWESHLVFVGTKLIAYINFVRLKIKFDTTVNNKCMIKILVQNLIISRTILILNWILNWEPNYTLSPIFYYQNWLYWIIATCIIRKMALQFFHFTYLIFVKLCPSSWEGLSALKKDKKIFGDNLVFFGNHKCSY